MPHLVRTPLLLFVASFASGLAAAEAPAADRARAALFLSTNGSDSNACTRRAPCRTFDRAYRRAKPGQIVEVRGGVYPGQEIGVDGSKTSPRDVRFRPAKGQRVEVAGSGLTVYGKHVRFRGLIVSGGWYAKPGSKDVTFRNVRTSDLFINSASNIRVIGGTVGPGVNYDSQIGGTPAPRNILLARVTFRKWTRTDDSHVECLQFGSGINVTIRRSRFIECATHDVFIRSWGPGYPLKNFLIENNVFDDTIEGYYSLKMKGDLNPENCGPFIVRNNTALQTMLAESCPGGVHWIGNLGPRRQGQCYGRFSSNVWYGSNAARCGATDRRARNPRFVAHHRLDLRLRPGSPAINAGHPRSYPRVDIRGVKRPKGGRPDAGAYESG